jgi:glycosyltransferase involved in cell wall biosynthesis
MAPVPDTTDATSAPPKVSVSIITYDQERYVAQALDSVLAQKVDFDYEIVVADDCSRDGTADILLDYQRRHGHRIRLVQRPQNIGMVRNFFRTFGACRGQYIAFLEGDDYWTSPHKLQRQADLLDRDPGLALCFHRARMVIEGTDHSGLHPPDGATLPSSMEDLLTGDCILTCTTMARNGLIGELPAWCEEMPIGDWPLFVLLARHGGIGYLEDEMATYRLHPTSAWSSLTREERLPLKIAARQKMSDGLGPPYERILAPVIERLREELRVTRAAGSTPPCPPGAA